MTGPDSLHVFDLPERAHLARRGIRPNQYKIVTMVHHSRVYEHDGVAIGALQCVIRRGEDLRLLLVTYVAVVSSGVRGAEDVRCRLDEERALRVVWLLETKE